MKKLLIWALTLVLVAGLSACCSPSPAQKASAGEVENSHRLIAEALMKYVNNDASLSPEARGRFKTMIDTDLENIKKLRKALGE